MKKLFSCEFCEISKNTSFYRTPLVAASENADNPTKTIKLNKDIFPNLSVITLTTVLMKVNLNMS